MPKNLARFAGAGVCLAMGLWAQPFAPTLNEIYFPRVASPILYGLQDSPRGFPMRSDDSGRTWKPLYPNPAGGAQPASDIAIDPANPRVVYLAVSLARGGVLKSTDGGETWTPSGAGLPSSGTASVYPLRVASNNAQVLYAAAGGSVYKSSDAGATWARTGGLSDPTAAIGFQDTAPARMFAMTGGGYTHSSEDEGATWTQTGRVGTDPEKFGIRMTIDAGNSSTVYAEARARGDSSGRCQSPGGGVWRSLDSGRTWTNIYESQYCDLSARVFVDHTRPILHLATFLISRFYCRSDNRGASFDCRDRQAPAGLDPRNPDRLFFGGGRQESADAGLTETTTGATVIPTLALAGPLEIAVEESSGRTVNQRFTALEGTGAYRVPFTASSNVPWLTLPSAAGTTAADFALRFDTSGLAPGSTHSGILRLSAPASANKAIDVAIRLTVQPRISSGFNYSRRQVLGGSANFSKPFAEDVPADTASASNCESGFLEPSGSLLVSCNDRIRRIDAAAGRVRTVAGDGTRGDNANGVPPLEAKFNFTRGVVSTPDGSIYVADRFNTKIKRVRDNSVTTVLDNTFVVVPGTFPVRFSNPSRIFIDNDGRPVVSAIGAWVKLNASDVPGTWIQAPPSPPNGPLVGNVFRDGAQGYYVADTSNHLVWRYTNLGWRKFAGTGAAGYNGDGQPALETQLSSPIAAVPDAEGNVYVLERGNNRLRIIGKDGSVGSASINGAATVATSASSLIDLMMAPDGSIYIVEFNGVAKLERQRGSKPVISQGSFVSAASGQEPLAPGSLFSVYGTGLAESTQVANFAPWPERLAGAAVRINGRTAPLYFTSEGQINGQVPFETASGQATIELELNGTKSDVVRAEIVPAAPGVLIFGENRAVAVNPDGQINGPDASARSGQVIVVYFTGQGALDTPVATGAAAPPDRLLRPVAASSATIGGLQAGIHFLGLAPGYIGLGQANVEIPGGLEPGDQDLVLTVGNRRSPPVRISAIP